MKETPDQWHQFSNTCFLRAGRDFPSQALFSKKKLYIKSYAPISKFITQDTPNVISTQMQIKVGQRTGLWKLLFLSTVLKGSLKMASQI